MRLSLALASVLIFFPFSAGAAGEREECAARVATYLALAPAELGGRPSDLRRLIADLRRDREVIAAANRPEDRELLGRIDTWTASLEREVETKDNGKDAPILGYGLVGYARPGETLLSLADRTPFEELASFIQTDPDRIGGVTSDGLRPVLNDARNLREKLARRGYPEDKVLVRRADRWMARLQKRIETNSSPADGGVLVLDVSTLDSGAMLGSDDPLDDAFLATSGEEIPPIERFFEIVLEGFIETLYKLAEKDEKLGPALKASAARRLSKRDQLLYLCDHPAMKPFLVAYAERTLPGLGDFDPRLIGAKVKNLQALEAQNQILLALLKEAKGESATTRLATAWLKVLRERLSPVAGEPEKKLDGYGMLGVSGMPFRLAPQDPRRLRFVPPLEPIETFLTEEAGSTVPEAAFEPALEKLPKPMAALVSLVQADNVLGPAYEANLRAVRASRLAPRSEARAQLLALMRNDDSRRLLVEVAREMIRRRQADLRAKEGAVRKVDILFAGAGLAEQNMQNYFRQFPGLTTLTVERQPVVGFTFRQGGYAFSLNSTTRLEDRTSLRQMFSGSGATMRAGDLNFLPGGVIQINRFETRQNPVAASMADAIEVNRALALEEAPVLVATEAGEVEWIGNDPVASEGGRYEFRARLSDGTTVLARVGIGTGIGVPERPAIPGLEEAYQLAKRAREPGKPPRIFDLEDIFAWINGNDDPYAPFSGETVGIGGPGDSGKALVRWFTLLSDPRSYGGSTRDLPLVASVPWYGQPCLTCDDFISQNRSFYADIGRPYRSGRIKGRPKIERVDFDGTELLVKPVGEAPEELTYLGITLGYRSLLPQLLAPMLVGRRLPRNPNDLVEQKAIFRNVLGYEPSLGQVTLARQLVIRDGDNQRPVPFYVVGAGAGKIVSEAELQNNEENRVANANQAWREWRMAEALRAQLAVSVGGELTGSEPPPPEEVPSWMKFNDFESGFDATIELAPGESARPPATGDGILLATRLWTELDFDAATRVVREIRITITRVQPNVYRFEVGPGALAGTRVVFSLGSALVRSAALRGQIASLLGNGSRTTAIQIDYKLTEAGQLDGDETTVAFRRR